MSERGPLRVLFVQSQTEMGGAEISLLTALGAVDRSRLTPAVATLGFGQGDFLERLREAGIEVFELQAGRLRNPFGWLRTVGKLSRIARRGGFGTLVSNGYHPHLYSHPAARRAGARSAMFCRDFPSPRRCGPWIERLAFMFGADTYLVASAAMAGAITERSGGRRPPRIVPNGVDMERFRPAPEAAAALRAELGLRPEHLLMTVAGRLQPSKGQHLFLEAAALVASAVPEARFLVVGGALFGMHGDYPDQLRAQAAGLDFSDKVIFAGNRADMPAVYAASDVIAMTSVLPEGFGRVVIEAMAVERPVLVARAGGATELFVEGQSGLGYEPGNAAELSEKMIALCRDADLRGRLGETARRRATELYSAERSAQALAEALELVSGRSASALSPGAVPKDATDAGAFSRGMLKQRTVPGEDDRGLVAMQEARYQVAAGKLGGMMVLDLGCGVGAGTQLLAGRGGRTIGVDLDIRTLRRASEDYGQDVLGFTAANALRLPFGEATFDGVVCFELLEHLPEPDLLMKEICRVLKPGGKLLLSTPNRLTESSLGLPGGPGVTPLHVSTPTPGELERLARSHFRNVHILGCRRRGSLMYAALRRLDYFNLRLRFRGKLRQNLAKSMGAPTGVPAGSAGQFVFSPRGLRQATYLMAICKGPLSALRVRLSVVTAAYPPDVGGVADHSQLLAAELGSRGLEVEVFTTAQGGPVAGDKLPVRRVKERWSLRGVRRLALLLAEDPKRAALFQYVPHLYGRAGFAPGAALLPLFCRFRGLRVVTHFHEVCVPWSAHPLRFLQSAVHRLQAAVLVFGSAGASFSNRRDANLMSWAVRLFGRPWSVLASGPTVPQAAVPSDQRAQIRSRWGREGESLVVSYGLASRAKRYDLALDALRLLKEEGRNLRLLMLGDQESGDGEYCREIREKAHQLGIEDRVSWSGPLPARDVSEILAVADLMWHLNAGGLTTRSGAAACALAQGLPVVAFGGQGLDSCFRDGDNVLAVAEVSARGLAGATAQLLSSPELAARLRAGARRLHDEVFAWPVIAESCLKLLQCAGVDVG